MMSIRRAPRFLLVSLLFATVSFISESRALEVPDQFSDAIRIMEKERANAEMWVKSIKRDYEAHQFQFRRAQRQYDYAASSFNALIKQLHFELLAGKRLGASREFWPALQYAAERNALFIDYVSKLYDVRVAENGEIIEVRRRFDSGGVTLVTGRQMASIPVLIARFVAKITQAMIMLWEIVSEVSEENRKNELTMFILESRWKYFEEV